MELLPLVIITPLRLISPIFYVLQKNSYLNSYLAVQAASSTINICDLYSFKLISVTLQLSLTFNTVLVKSHNYKVELPNLMDE